MGQPGAPELGTEGPLVSTISGLRVAYLCLQATTPGQASYAHVHEIIKGLRGQGALVDLYEPSYAGSASPGAAARLAEFLRIQRDLVRRLSEYDVLYVRGHAFAWPASAFARSRGVPVVQECNGMVEDFFIAWPSARAIAPVIRGLTYRQFRQADEVIVGSTGLGEWLERVTGRDYHIVPNGANTDIFQPMERPEFPLPNRYVVFFGSLAPWQGIDTTLAAVTTPEWPADVSLVVVGDGVKRPEVEDAARASATIRYLGTKPYDQIAAIVANSVASLVNKEQTEFASAGISPLKLYESMACAVPVIATERMPGLTEVVRDQRAGLIVPQGDPHALATAVATLASDDALRAEMGARGRAYAEKDCSWLARSEDTAAVITAAARRRRAPRG